MVTVWSQKKYELSFRTAWTDGSMCVVKLIGVFTPLALPALSSAMGCAAASVPSGMTCPRARIQNDNVMHNPRKSRCFATAMIGKDGLPQ
jgi:hypothetical protein